MISSTAGYVCARIASMKRAIVRAPFLTPRQTLTSGSPGMSLPSVHASVHDRDEIAITLLERKLPGRSMNPAAPRVIVAAREHKHVIHTVQSLGQRRRRRLDGP